MSVAGITGCQALPTHAVCKGHDGKPLWVQDCNVVIYDGNLATSGPFAPNAIYDTATTNAGMHPCQLLWQRLSCCPINADIYNSMGSMPGRRWAIAELAGHGKS